MKYLRVVGWERYQHYKNRRAPWIKSYTDILDALEHPKFTNLTDGAKLTLHHLRLLAGVTGNTIPETWVTSGHLNMQTKPRVTELEDAGFVEWVSATALAQDAERGLAALARTPQSDRGNDPVPRAGAHARAGAPDRAHSPDSLGSSLSSPTGWNGKSRVCARELVENFVVTDKHRAWATEKVPGVDVIAATDAWRDYLRANGYRTKAGVIADADGSWRNWMRNERKFGRTPVKPTGGGGKLVV